MPTHITSPQNTHIKEIVKLDKRSVRDERKTTVVEGIREISRALDAGLIPLEAYICPQLTGAQQVESPTLVKAVISRLERLENQRRTHLFTVTAEIFAKIAYRGESGGLLLVIPYLERTLDDLLPFRLTPVHTAPFLVVIEGVEKPGNLGAILRTADAAGVQGVIVTDAQTDSHNPNVIRASLGARFTVPVIEASSEATLAFLRGQGIQLVAADPVAPTGYTKSNLEQPTALILGSEAHGLSETMRTAADLHVKIPMHGVVDSLNLATATALLMYEVVRQRGGL